MAELSGMQFHPQVHLPPRPMSAADLEPYQRPMASEDGPRQLNALQQEFNKHPSQGVQ